MLKALLFNGLDPITLIDLSHIQPLAKLGVHSHVFHKFPHKYKYSSSRLSSNFCNRSIENPYRVGPQYTPPRVQCGVARATWEGVIKVLAGQSTRVDLRRRPYAHFNKVKHIPVCVRITI